MSQPVWTDERRNRLLEWAEAEGVDDDEIINKMFTKPEFTRADLEYLRQFPGFSKVEAQIVPTTDEKLADKIASEYSSIDDVPKAYLIDMQKQGLTDADLVKAFAKRDEQAKYDTMIASQEQREKDLKEAQKWSGDKSLSEKALATVYKLIPKEADRYYIRHGIKNGGSILDNLGLVGSAILGNIANFSEIVPNPVISTIVSPVSRTIESALSGEKYDIKDGIQDLAGNAVSNVAFRKLGDLVKGAIGQFFPNFEKTAAPNKIDKLTSDLEIASQGPKAIKDRQKLQKKYSKIFNDLQKMDKVEIEKAAREMESNGFPGIASATREYNVTKQFGEPSVRTEAVKAEMEYPYNFSLSADKKNLLNRKKQPVDMDDIRSPQTLKNRQAAIDLAVANSPGKKILLSAKALDLAGRPVVRYLSNPEMDSNMIRQWEAGFIPREGTDLYEQYMIWKKAQNKESK